MNYSNNYSSNYLEHANITVENPDLTAQRLMALFDWEIRWSGAAMDKGYTVHVGTKNDYIALYTKPDLAEKCGKDNHAGHLNHIGVVVKDPESISSRAKDLGLEPFNFGQYEPGSRFYLMLEDTLEIEIVCYQ